LQVVKLRSVPPCYSCSPRNISLKLLCLVFALRAKFKWEQQNCSSSPKYNCICKCNWADTAFLFWKENYSANDPPLHN